MFLLEQNITKKGQIDKTPLWIKPNKCDNNEYKVKAICNSKVYFKELNSTHHRQGLYYLDS